MSCDELRPILGLLFIKLISVDQTRHNDIFVNADSDKFTND